MIRQAAFTGKLPLLKGNLHTHTTRSDGRGTPEEVIRLYFSKGYDFLALTDHRLYNYQNFAKEIPITILPGMELDKRMEGPGIHCFHTVCLGPSREDGNGFAQDQVFESGIVRDQEDFQQVLDMVHANNNFTFYCHPQWSRTPAREFEKLKGNFAMEIWNSGCAVENEMDTNAAHWDELLLQGKRIFGAATDDCHKADHYGLGWVKVNSKNDISSILRALYEGAFYSSCGPDIYDFYVKDGVATVECSPCDRIIFLGGLTPSKLFRSENGPIQRAEIKIPEYLRYIRACVVDEKGRRAWTNPIFLSQRESKETPQK